MKAIRKTTIAGACAAVLLTACGGGGSSVSTGDTGGTTPVVAAQLSGTAAGGAPLVGTVTVKDSKGATKTVDIAADGSYEVDVAGMTGPFMVRASGIVGGVSVTYYSAATSDDFDNKVNVTPFTTLLISNIAAKLAETYYNEGNYANVTNASLDTAVSNLQKKLAPALEALGLSKTIDLLRASFAADHSGLDAALDVIKVSIDPATNVATLTNALNNNVIGTDDLGSTSDDGVTVTLSDAEKTALGAAPTELQKVRGVLEAFVKLFATGLPSDTQIISSGLFDTTPGAFVMGGASLAQFASDISTESELIGMKLLSSDIAFSPSNSNLVIVKGKLGLAGGLTDQLEFQFAKDGSGEWKMIGDGRIADISVRPFAIHQLAQPGGHTSFTTGLQMYAEVDQYNTNHSGPGEALDKAVITGPGIRPAAGITYQSYVGIKYLAQSAGGDNIIPECTLPGHTNCLDIAQMPDNASYNVKLYSGTTERNGAGYTYMVAKKALPSAGMSTGQFPAIAVLTVDGVNVTQLAHFQPGKNLSMSWSMPAGLHASYLNVQFLRGTPPGAGGRESIEDNLVVGSVSKLLSLETAPIGATYAHVWLSGRDVYGREFVANRRYD